MPLPVPLIDHVVVHAAERLAEAAARWRRLGFTLTPRGDHSLGSSNHLAVLRADYIELIGQPADGARAELRGWPVGLNALVFAIEDPAAVAASLAAAGLEATPPQALSRPVVLPDGTCQQARFTTVRLARGTSPVGRFYFCRHETRELVWRDEWRRHANAAVGVARAVLAAHDPSEVAALFARMFGPTALRRRGAGYRLTAGLAAIDVLPPAALAEEYGAAAPDGAGRAAWMAALELRSAELAVTADALRGLPGLSLTAAAITVPAEQAMGVALRFVP